MYIETWKFIPYLPRCEIYAKFLILGDMFRLFLQKRVFVLSRHEQKYKFYKFRCNNLHFRLESKKLICSRFCAKLQLLQYITTRKEEKRRSKSYSLQIERYEFHLFPFQSHFLLIRNFVSVIE